MYKLLFVIPLVVAFCTTNSNAFTEKAWLETCKIGHWERDYKDKAKHDNNYCKDNFTGNLNVGTCENILNFIRMGLTCERAVKYSCEGGVCKD